MKDKNLTKKQFEQSISDFPRLKENGYNVAYYCLVEDWMPAEASVEFKVSQSYVRKVVNDVYNNYLSQYLECPKGWVQYTSCVPKNRVNDIKKIEADARKAL